MAFFLFILVNATLLVRPAEIIPDLAELPIYNALMVATILCALPAILRQWTGRSLASSPISACVLGLHATVVASHAGNGNFTYARVMGLEFSKNVMYYFVLVGLLDTPARLLGFLRLLAGSIAVMASLTLLHFFGVIALPAMETLTREEVDASSGALYSVLQLQGMGIFADPNDLCLILVAGMGVALHGMGDRRLGPLRGAWAAPFLLLGYTLALTNSRGGFLGLLAGMLTTFCSRFGPRRSIPLVVVGLPAAFFLFAGRQTNLSTSSGTGQARIQLWAAGLDVFRQRPIFGVGQGLVADEIGQEAHNSFVHCYPDMGFLGGTLFLAMYGASFATLRRLGRRPDAIADPDLRQLRPYLMGIVAAYSAGMLSISRAYIVPTYMIPGLVAAFARLASPSPPVRLDGRFARDAAIGSVAFLVSVYFYVRAFANYGG